MTDAAPLEATSKGLLALGAEAWRNLTKERRGRTLFGVAYGLAVVITAVGIWVVAVAPGAVGVGPRAVAARAVLFVLVGNLALILGLAAFVGQRVLKLARDRKEAGARLHLRFVTLFSAVALIPAVVIALTFGVLANRGVDQWFSQNVSNAVQNGAEIGKAYIADVSSAMDSDVVTIADQLTEVRPLFDNRVQFSDALMQIADFFGYPAIYIINGDGVVLAQGETAEAPPYRAPPRAVIEAAAEGGPPLYGVTQSPDAARSLYRLPSYGDAYLYVARPLQPGLIARMSAGDSAIQAYREAEESRGRLQAAFSLGYLETVLLVLVGAVWLGMSAANAIAAPVGRLVSAANQVSAGDLSVRVDTAREPGEIAVLSQAFNRMTGDLQAQQAALRAASEEATARSRFIETVLSGVSAGVIGLDRQGRVSAINDSAIDLLALTGDVLGQKLGKVSPELSDLVRRAEAHIEEDIDVSRDGETRRLRVRIEGGVGGEMVLTFDDITRLVTAQRNAAWRDVARRIAHEIKNPLTPIQLSAERLRRKYRSKVDDVEIFDRCTETIIRQVGDIGRMVDEFSAFARMPTPRFAPENGPELLRQAVFAQRVAAPEIGVELAEPLPDLMLECDGRMVGQALTNILKNAGESVASQRARHGMNFGKARPGIIARLVLEDDHAVFVVEDDGLGLPAKDRDRLTEPYVTTREKGTGLGLAIVKRICEDHGGELRLADAEALGGARVCLTFPLKPPAPAQAPTRTGRPLLAATAD